MELTLLRKELHLSLQLASPLVAALLAQVAMELINSLMLGRLGAEALAAGGLGIAIFFMLLVICNGLFSAVGVLIARNYGGGNHSEIPQFLNHALYLACFLAIPFIGILWNAPKVLLMIGEQPVIVAMTTEFLHALVWGIPPLLAYFSLREFIAALSHTRIIMLLSLGVAPLTGLGNYILMYGKLGIPALGIAGVGYSTAFMEWVLLLVVLIYIFKNKILRPYFLFYQLRPIEWGRLLEMIKLGIPVSITMGLEVGLFSVTTLLMGYFGTNSLAAHQIALQCATLAFMFPLGIAQATAIRVGQSLGAGSVRRAKYAGYAGLILGIGVAIITAVIFVTFPTAIISLFINTHEPNYKILVTMGARFLGVLALFQLLDAIQVIMNGALRGLKDTFVPMWLGLLSYWVSGLISGYALAFIFKQGGIGLWWGLGIGIGVSGVLLLLRFIQRIREETTLGNFVLSGVK